MNILMINNFLKIALRSLLKNRLLSLINIFGLVTGLTGSIFIGLYIIDELQYDRHYRFKERMFRLTTSLDPDGTKYHSATTSGNIGSALAQKFPEVASVARLLAKDEVFLFADKKAFKEEIIYTDAGFSRVFSPVILLGNKKQCRANPSSIIISKGIARKMFGENWRKNILLGKALLIDGRIPLAITAVFDDFPKQSHFTSQLFATVPTEHKEWMNDKSKVYTYVLLRPNANVENFAGKLNSTVIDQNPSSENIKINLQPIASIHFSPVLRDENALKGNIENIYALLLVCVALILITVTNFVNLYTAGSFNRMREVGVRKALGALRIQLRFQFLLETFLITMVSLVISLILVAVGLKEFNELTSKNLSLNDIIQENTLLFFGGLVLSIPLLAGFYPSIYLSGLHTIEALKGKKGQHDSVLSWRKGLIILQFSISAIMITLSIVAYRQVGLINDMPLGFNKENTVALSNPYMLVHWKKLVDSKMNYSHCLELNKSP